MMTLDLFLKKLNATPDLVEFADTMAAIDVLYAFTPMAFTNGELVNEAGQNSGSCKLFSFALMNDLSEEKALACFGYYFRDDVLQNPAADDHQNIRNFMKTGWQGIRFQGVALTAL